MSKIKITSGGLTGVERAALKAAKKRNLEIGGYCVQGKLAQDNILPEDYNLIELETDSYSKINQRHFNESDATLLLEILTVDYDNYDTIPLIEEKVQKICLNGNPQQNQDQAVQIFNWIKENNIQNLFITGPKASHNNSVDVEKIAHDFLYLHFFTKFS
ncbi:molybdenum cofactor carrier [Gigaspora margarita]|uniref:Molybdenum cofactor carrier n=1 Tax=Gigaspora margarita TaxID=4874 RepID=A0A8H3XIP5_GIGMA|nr:molybdenum cofactor carrier [Gigaspora margarita]